MNKITRRAFGATAGAGLLMPHLLAGRAAARETNQATGPLIGHVSESTAHVWYRPGRAGSYTLSIMDDGGAALNATAAAREADDYCITWALDGLKPGSRYRYQIADEDGRIIAGGEDSAVIQTAPSAEAPGTVCLAFGSCAQSKPLKLWRQMGEAGAQGVILLGDTPYIDSTDLAVQRKKHREFLQVPELAELVRTTPTWATWDDHDFGKNDSDGTLPGKENARQAFVEYRANAEFGHEDQGIYTKFRHGAIEVFLLDTRWFARTEPSPVDPEKPTLLGERQWEWLRESLKASTAPFKLITCGMIWDDKENTESDDWGTYSYERAALFDFLGANNITGVVLIGGDIHCSRLLQYKTETQVGYAIRQCIVSPIHDSTIPSLNVAHPDLVEGAAIPHVWLRVEADTTKSPATLEAKWLQMDGQKMWTLSLTEDELRKEGA